MGYMNIIGSASGHNTISAQQNASTDSDVFLIRVPVQITKMYLLRWQLYTYMNKKQRDQLNVPRDKKSYFCLTAGKHIFADFPLH